MVSSRRGLVIASTHALILETTGRVENDAMFTLPSVLTSTQLLMASSINAAEAE